jgi:outer membrane protein assembly factor BamE (lipoprotein component of BamABCDE complex)
MKKFSKKLGFISLLIGLSVSASATINGFDPSVKLHHDKKTTHPRSVNLFADESDLNNMAVGLNKAQVRLLIGSSQLQDSIVTTHSWSFLFKFSELNKRDLVCQYQIQFDDHQLVTASYFDSQACVDHLHPPLPNVTIEPPKPVSTPEALESPVIATDTSS